MTDPLVLYVAAVIVVLLGSCAVLEWLGRKERSLGAEAEAWQEFVEAMEREK